MTPGWGGKIRWWAPFLVFDALTGLRLREIQGLRWHDLDTHGARMRIRHQVKVYRGQVEFVEPKTNAGIRSVGIPEYGMELLEDHRERLRTHRLRMKDPREWQDYDLIFPSMKGRPGSPQMINETLRDFMALAGLPPISVKALRHGFASALFEQGVPNRSASKTLGTRTRGDLVPSVLPSYEGNCGRNRVRNRQCVDTVC